jgi:hypothetical protein
VGTLERMLENSHLEYDMDINSANDFVCILSTADMVKLADFTKNFKEDYRNANHQLQVEQLLCDTLTEGLKEIDVEETPEIFAQYTLSKKTCPHVRIVFPEEASDRLENIRIALDRLGIQAEDYTNRDGKDMLVIPTAEASKNPLLPFYFDFADVYARQTQAAEKAKTHRHYIKHRSKSHA